MRTLLDTHRSLVFRLILLLAATGLLLGGCDEKKEPEKKPSKAPAAEYLAESPAWPAELEAVKLGQPIAEWREALGVEGDEYESPKYEGIDYDSDDDDGIVKKVSVYFDHDDAIGFITGKWGAPTEVDDYGTKTSIWFAPDAGLRVRVRNAFDNTWSLDYGTYIPVAKVIGTEPGALGFEKDKPLVGLTGAEIVAAYPLYARVVSKEEAEENQAEIAKMAPEAKALMGEAMEDIEFRLPPTELDSVWTSVLLSFNEKNGKVERYSLGIKVAPDGAQAIVDMLKAKNGEPKMGKDGDKDRYAFFAQEAGLRIIAGMDTISEGEFEINMAGYTSLDKLIGKDKTKLAFFGDAHPVGTLTEEDFRKNYVEYLPTADASSIHIPPVGYDDYFTSIGVYFDTKSKVAHSVNFDLDFEHYPGFKDEIFAYYKEVYGEPTTGKDHSEAKPKWIFAGEQTITMELGYSDNSWRIEYQGK